MNEKVVERTLYDVAYDYMQHNEDADTTNEADDVINVKGDKGGETVCGVSSRWFPQDVAILKSLHGQERQDYLKRFYQREFWHKEYDQFNDKRLAVKTFDLAINMDTTTAIKLLQHAINRFNTLHIAEDGRLGQRTVFAINHPIGSQDEFYNHYLDIVEEWYRTRSDFKKFGRGWLNRLRKKVEV